jgi:apolipoprotein N-acyltransferase
VTSARAILARGLGLPLIAGAASVLGFAPFYAWPVPIAALAALFWVWTTSGSPRQAWLSGFAFGLGFFLAGVSWVYISLHVYGAMPAVLAAIATFLFCAYLALFPAIAGWLAVRLAGGNRRLRLAAATGSFTLLEWLRGWLFTGFPWLTLGTSQAPSGPLAGFAPVVGAYGVTLAMAAIAALAVAGLSLSTALPEGGRRKRLAMLAAIAALFAVGGVARLVPWTEPAGAPVTVALLQGNIPQQIKWREDVRTATLLEYRRMIFEAKAPVVIIPETALPAFLDQLPADYVQSLREHARVAGKDILLGTVERTFRGNEFDYYNSLVRLTGDGLQSYRKRHLVPFGEFIPWGFKWVLAILKIPLSDFTSGASKQPPLSANGTTFAVAICYEDIFGREMVDALPAAQVLLNVSNLAWFGDSLAPEQHLQESQMRALENGRWMVRSTNTGATGGDRRARPRDGSPAEFHAGHVDTFRDAAQRRHTLHAGVGPARYRRRARAASLRRDVRQTPRRPRMNSPVPLVSILIPAYNERFFAEAFESALAQTGRAPRSWSATIRRAGRSRRRPSVPPRRKSATCAIRSVSGSAPTSRNALRSRRANSSSSSTTTTAWGRAASRTMARVLAGNPAVTLATSRRRVIDADGRECPGHRADRAHLPGERAHVRARAGRPGARRVHELHRRADHRDVPPRAARPRGRAVFRWGGRDYHCLATCRSG